MVTSSNKPLISVAIVTYNHEKYIAKALESVLAQKGSFSLEIIVGEDSSTDSIYAILQRYKETYPDIIKILKENGNMGALKNMIRVLKACSGDYIAILDGDDYWTNENKLQKQLDLLSSDSSLAACQHETSRVDEQERLLQSKLWDETIPATVTQKDLFKSENLSQTSTWLFRRSCIDITPTFLEQFPYDRVLAFYIAGYGNWGSIPEVMSAYRIHNTGIFSKQSEERKTQQVIEIYEAIWSYTPYRVLYKTEINERLRYLYKQQALGLLTKKALIGYCSGIMKAMYHTPKIKDKLFLVYHSLNQLFKHND